jgi:hypothetical protein
VYQNAFWQYDEKSFIWEKIYIGHLKRVQIF